MTMKILQSTRETLRGSLPSILDSKKPTWPAPEQSIGEEVNSIGNLKCWTPAGPALAAMKILLPSIAELLNKHKDTLKQGEPKPGNVSFTMWMIGPAPEFANPTIVFSSKSRRQRTYAKVLLKDSKLLDDYPGMKIKAWDRVPLIPRAGEQVSGDDDDGTSEDGVYMVDDSCGPCGALIAFGTSRLTTMGGTLLVGGVLYGISAQHARSAYIPDATSWIGENACFDEDSDTAELDLVEVTSRAGSESVSSDSNLGSPTISFASTGVSPDITFEYLHSFSGPFHGQRAIQPPAPREKGFVRGQKISELENEYEHTDLDYELFQITDPEYHVPNKIRISAPGEPAQIIVPANCARDPAEIKVFAATGPTGCVQGMMTRQIHFIRMGASETFQEMWAVKLDRETKPGDCGAWIVDIDGNLYGHIIAGDPMLNLAYIIPAYKIFEDIKQRYGFEPLLPSDAGEVEPLSDDHETREWCLQIKNINNVEPRIKYSPLLQNSSLAQEPSYRPMVGLLATRWKDNTVSNDLSLLQSCLLQLDMLGRESIQILRRIWQNHSGYTIDISEGYFQGWTTEQLETISPLCVVNNSPGFLIVIEYVGHGDTHSRKSGNGRTKSWCDGRPVLLPLTNHCEALDKDRKRLKEAKARPARVITQTMRRLILKRVHLLDQENHEEELETMGDPTINWTSDISADTSLMMDSISSWLANGHNNTDWLIGKGGAGNQNLWLQDPSARSANGHNNTGCIIGKGGARKQDLMRWLQDPSARSANRHNNTGCIIGKGGAGKQNLWLQDPSARSANGHNNTDWFFGKGGAREQDLMRWLQDPSARSANGHNNTGWFIGKPGAGKQNLMRCLQDLSARSAISEARSWLEESLNPPQMQMCYGIASRYCQVAHRSSLALAVPNRPARPFALGIGDIGHVIALAYSVSDRCYRLTNGGQDAFSKVAGQLCAMTDYLRSLNRMLQGLDGVETQPLWTLEVCYGALDELELLLWMYEPDMKYDRYVHTMRWWSQWLLYQGLISETRAGLPESISDDLYRLIKESCYSVRWKRRLQRAGKSFERMFVYWVMVLLANYDIRNFVDARAMIELESPQKDTGPSDDSKEDTGGKPGMGDH